MATLTGVRIHINVGDGVDNDSSVLFQLYHLNQANVIATHSDSNVPNNTPFDRELTVVNSTLDKTQINQTTFYLEINAHGRDTFNGNLNIYFTYSDGSTNSFGYGAFEIGTFHMSNSTRKQVNNVA